MSSELKKEAPAPEGGEVKGPGGYLVKDFADGWYWTPNAALDHASGASVWSVADGRYETDPPAPATREEAPAEAGGDEETLAKVLARADGENPDADWFEVVGQPAPKMWQRYLPLARAALRAQPPAREEDGGTLDPAFVAWLRERDCLPNDDDGTIEWADIVCALNDWEADLTQAREDAQPVGWQRRIRNTAAPSSSPKSQWSKWVDCDDRQRKDAQETGGVPGFPELIAEVRPIYTRPAPDALRVAVEALEPFSEIAGRYLAGGMRADLEARSPGLLDLIEPRDFYRARKALAALQAEQDSKS